MYSNWVNVLDNLAAGGVIDFGAPAYLLDQPARYVGHPKFADLPLGVPLSISALNSEPVSTWGKPKNSANFEVWVPFPQAGGPKK